MLKHPFAKGRNIRVGGLAKPKVRIWEAGLSGPFLDFLTSITTGAVGRATVGAAQQVSSSEAGTGGEGVMVWGDPSGTVTYPSGASYAVTSQGTVGGSVRAAQQNLQAAGYNLGPSGVDGAFGPCTAAAIRAYIQDHGQTAAGVVFGTTMVSRALSTSGTCSSAPRTSGAAPSGAAPAEEEPGKGAAGAGGGLLQRLQNAISSVTGSTVGTGGGPASVVARLSDPLFLGLIGAGLLGAYYIVQRKKNKKAKAEK